MEQAREKANRLNFLDTPPVTEKAFENFHEASEGKEEGEIR
jgi:nicotinamide riboside kinase